jgi:hypothetical protein
MRIATGEIEDAPSNAGISNTLWSVTDMAEMIDATLPKTGKRGSYKKRAA